MNKNTSWGSVAGWYDSLVDDKDSYQNKVILPNILRLMDIKEGETVLDLACGSGFFTRAFAEAGANVIGIDISKELINIAKEKSKIIRYIVLPADNLDGIESKSVDKIAVVLAIQNIKNFSKVFDECFRVLRPDGKLFLVLNHPAFRIPKRSEWGYDEKRNVQYRRVDEYISESESSIEMHPGDKKSPKTISFHRPLQSYFKSLSKVGFLVSRLEEWMSHKESEKGPKQSAENRARNEIPLFLFIEAVKK